MVAHWSGLVIVILKTVSPPHPVDEDASQSVVCAGDMELVLVGVREALIAV